MCEMSGRSSARAGDAQGTPTQSHISSNVLSCTKIKPFLLRSAAAAGGVRTRGRVRGAGGVMLPAEDGMGGNVEIGARDGEAKPSEGLEFEGAPSRGRAGVGMGGGGEGGARRAALRDVVDVCLVSAGGHVGFDATLSPSFRTRKPEPETRNLKPETRNSKPNPQAPKSQTLNPKPQTLNVKPDLRVR